MRNEVNEAKKKGIQEMLLQERYLNTMRLRVICNQARGDRGHGKYFTKKI